MDYLKEKAEQELRQMDESRQAIVERGTVVPDWVRAPTECHRTKVFTEANIARETSENIVVYFFTLVMGVKIVVFVKLASCGRREDSEACQIYLLAGLVCEENVDTNSSLEAFVGKRF